MLQSRTCLGVDTTGEDIKVVELRKSRGKYEVVQAARLKVSGDIGIALKHFLLETDTDPSSAVFALPTNSCSVKFAMLPKTNPAETARMARYEAETQIPLPLTDLIWAYSAEKSAKDESLRPIVLAGVRHSIVEQSVLDMESSNLPLSALMVASLAEAKGLREQIRALDWPVFVIDIADGWTDLTTVRGGRVTLCRSINLGLRDLVLAVAADLNMSLPDAQEWIKQHPVLQSRDSSDDPTVVTQVQQWMESMALEVRRSALSGISAADQKPLKTAILVGEGSSIIGLGEVLGAKTSLSVEMGDPWLGMSLGLVVSHNKKDLPATFAVATGLAMAGLEKADFINLMPQQRAEERIRRRREMTLLSGFGVIAVLLLSLLVAGHSGIGEKSAQLDDLRARIKTVKKSAGHIEPGLKGTASTMEKLVADLQNKKNSPIETLRLLSMSLPKSCWLSEFRFESGKSVVLRGNALSNSAVADAVYVISNADVFETVSLDYSNLGRNADKQVYEFQVKCTLPPGMSFKKQSKSAKSSKARLVVR